MLGFLLLLAVTADPPQDVLMIAIDDMRPELGCYGCEYMRTPNMDKLASASLVFDHMYTGLALCAPSRTIFLTSRRPDTSRVWKISAAEYWRTSGGNFTSLPQFFKEAGYLTLGTGKIFHPGAPSNDSDSQYSWSPEALPYVNTFPEPDGSSIYSGNAVQPYSSLNTTDDQMGEGQLARHMESLLQLIHDKRASGDDARPFFMAAGFHRPHIPWHAPSKYFDMYNLSLPLAPHQHTPTDVPPIALNGIWQGSGGDAPGPGKGYWTGFPDLHAVNVSGHFPLDNTTVPEAEQARIRQAYRAALSFTDRNIGVVLDAAERLGLLRHAIVVLWADHGYQLGDNDQYGKHTNFEHATRIPFMVRLPADRYPGFAPGRSSAFVENVDLMPTLAELALPAKPLPRCAEDANASRATRACTDGLSFAPLLTQRGGGGGGGGGDIARWKNASFSQYNRNGENPPNGVMGYSIRVDGWRYTEWVKFDRAHAGYPGGAQWEQLVGAELYEHATGVPKGCDWSYEHTNLANQPAYADTRVALSARLRAGWRHALPGVTSDER